MRGLRLFVRAMVCVPTLMWVVTVRSSGAQGLASADLSRLRSVGSVAVSPDGSPPVPSVVIEIPWPSTALLVLGLAAVLALVVLVVARVQRFVEPAELLRDGSEL